MGSSSLEEEPEDSVFATDDEWVIDEANMELIRVHRQMRKAKYEPKEGHTPILLESLDTQRKTIMEFSKSKIVTQEDDWKVSERPTTKASESWKGRTVFRILLAGIESKTTVPAKARDPARDPGGLR